jgi:tetratricopeptide (TPR) repeat protein
VRLEKFSGGLEGETITDRTGKFQFAGMPPAQYIIKVHLPGFRDEQRQIDLQTTTSEYVLFQLLPETVDRPKSGARSKVVDADVPISAQQEFNRAEDAFLENNLDEEVRHLERAVALYPRFIEAMLRLGTAYMDLAQWDKAEETLSRALQIDGKVPNVLFALAEVNLKKDRYAEAEKLLIEGLRLENRSWQGHFTLGRLYWTRGDLVKAGKQIALTLQLNPSLADAHLLGANILLRADKREDALGEFEEYLRLAPRGQYSAQVRQITQKIKAALRDEK